MKNTSSNKKYFKVNRLSHLIAYALFGCIAVPLAAYADEELDEIQVVGKTDGESSKAQRSISRVVKTAEQIKKEQVTDIRDLTRYDPGIAVNEQGSGASAGYSIRGVDKDRVAIMVDGIPQAQTYAPTSNYSQRFSGAKNEIEFENIKSVEISQGANSVMSGSGSLGGSVSFTSKDPDDVIKPGQNWGLDITNNYTSRDDRWSKSIAAAGRVGGFAALLQYTRRDGHEIKSHKNTPNQRLNRMFPTEYQYEDLRAGGWDITRPSFFPQTSGCDSQLAGDCFAEVNLAPNDVYGETRNAADPMDYRSDSWYGKFQYEFNPSHKIGMLFENTKQLREIEKRSYSFTRGNSVERAFWHNRDEANPSTSRAYSYWALFPRYDFVDHDHRKERFGLFYEYTPETKNSFIDHLKLELDHDKTVIGSNYTVSRCTLIGHKPNRDCDIFDYQGELLTISQNVFVPNKDGTPGGHYEVRTPGGIGDDNHNGFQRWRRTETVLEENYKRIRLNAQKSWKYFGIQHDMDLQAGIGRSRFNLTETYLRKGYYYPEDSMPQSTTRPDIFLKPVIDTSTASPNNQPINGTSYYLGMSNIWQVGHYLELIGGARYDSYKFSSSMPYFKDSQYSSLSWLAGVSMNLGDHVTVHYKASTGFRVPNAQEMYGSDTQRRLENLNNRAILREKIEKEEALNHEVGFDIHGNVGYIALNIFRADYKNFIVERRKHADSVTDPVEAGVSYIGNQTEAFSEGFNIRGVMDFNALWHAIPEGFSGSVAYSKVRPRKIGKISGDKSNHGEASFAMDTLQPAKVVLGVDYDAPSGKWGIGTRFTRSDAKKASELVSVIPNIDERGVRQVDIVRKTSKSWYTWDLNGYVELHKNVMLRGGIYNLLNAKYITWESLRQIGKPGVSTADVTVAEGVGYDRLTAPGRNFALSLEIKF